VTDPASKLADRLIRHDAPLRQSVSDDVADQIRRMVYYGELRDGERVPQRQLAEAFGVSSVPVREALAGLQREGVVTIEQNRGAFVNGLDADVIVEQFYVYGRIYGRAARVAAERADDATVAKLVKLEKEIQQARDMDVLRALGVRFQMTIVDAGGSKRLRALFTPLSLIVPGNFLETVPGSDELTRSGVKRIANAIKARHAADAEQACWELIDEIGELVAEQFRQRTTP